MYPVRYRMCFSCVGGVCVGLVGGSYFGMSVMVGLYHLSPGRQNTRPSKLGRAVQGLDYCIVFAEQEDDLH